MRHRRGSVQQVYLLVRCILSIKPVGFSPIDRYPELRVLELKQLARELLSSDLSPTVGSLKAKIKSYTHGQLPHAEHILPALYELMEGDESVEETPLPAAAPQNQHVTGGYLDGLKEALTSSLTSGTFLDSQFFAVETRSSTGSPKIRPIYFCSGVGGNFVSKLVMCKFLALAMCGRLGDPISQIPRNSEHGRHYLPDVQTGMTAILRMKILTRRAPRNVTLRRSGSTIHS